MIKITRNGDYIEFRGHTIPDICAAVSSIMYTSVNMLVKYNSSCFTFEDNPEDDFVAIDIWTHDEIIDMIINNMFDMLNDLIEDGNDDKIKIN